MPVLIAILIVAGVAFLSKGAKALKAPVRAPGEFSPTGLATMLTHKPHTPDGSPTFTPGTSPTVKWILPIKLIGMDQADPEVAIIRKTYDNEKPTEGLTAMLQVQNFYGGGFQ